MSKTNCYVIKQILKIKSPFDNIALVMLFKHRKLLFKIHYQTAPKFLLSQIMYKK